jgi:hypothetical protein
MALGLQRLPGSLRACGNVAQPLTCLQTMKVAEKRLAQRAATDGKVKQLCLD